MKINQHGTVSTSIRWSLMTQLGAIAEIWRYPVSSLGGELCRNAVVGPRGITGDRQFALFDPRSGAVAAPETMPQWRPALFLRSANDNQHTIIGFPDGTWLEISDPALRSALQRHFGFEVAVGRFQQADLSHANILPIIQNRYTPSPLHLLTTWSLEQLKELTPGSNIDPRRFRPNVLVKTSTGANADWLGAILRMGEVQVKSIEETRRCGMTLIAQPGLEEQPDILRTLVRHNKRSLGLYCEVTRSGQIEVGDQVTSSTRLVLSSHRSASG